MRRLLFAGLAILLTLGLVAWSVVNRAPVTVAFPLTDLAVRLPLHLVFFAGVIFGVCLAGLVSLLPRLRERLHRRRLGKRAMAAENRLEELESRPPPDTGPGLNAIDRAQEVGGASRPRRSA